MANMDRRLYVRITEDEREKALALADSLGLTMSDLIRVLLRLPAEYVSGTESRPVWLATRSGTTNQQNLVPAVSKPGTASKLGWYRRHRP